MVICYGEFMGFLRKKVMGIEPTRNGDTMGV